MTTIKAALSHAKQALADTTETPEFESRLLLCHLLGKPESFLFTWPEKPLTESQQETFRRLIDMRRQGKPVAQITASRGFWSLDLTITPDVLIPRADSEMLIEVALQMHDRQTQLRVLDMGTGSGALALALASERQKWEIHASDVSDAALAVARKNAEKHQLAVQFHLGHWYEALAPDDCFDLIVSNPPYIRNHDPHLTIGDLRFEPRLALTSGDDGLDAIRCIIAGAKGHLKSHASLILEHGYNQAQDVAQLLADAGFIKIRNHVDHGGNPRITAAQHSY